MGYFLDQIYSFLDVEASVTVEKSSEMIPHEAQLICAVILAFFIISNWCKPRLQVFRRSPLPMVK